MRPTTAYLSFAQELEEGGDLPGLALLEGEEGAAPAPAGGGGGRGGGAPGGGRQRAHRLLTARPSQPAQIARILKGYHHLNTILRPIKLNQYFFDMRKWFLNF
jgi:hypothetical protein